MADDPERAQGAAASAPSYVDGEGAYLDEDDLGPEDEDWSSWRNLWQIPAIVASITLIGLGLFVAGRRAPEPDLGHVLDRVETLIGAGKYDEAKTVLRDEIEPVLPTATAGEESRYHVALADWVSAVQEARGVSLPDNNRLIDTSYRRAVEIGATLGPARLERWANALIGLDDSDGTPARLDDLEALAATSAGLDARDRRNRVLRRLVETSVRKAEGEGDGLTAALLEEIETYRAEPGLRTADRAWAIIQQARLRLDADRPDEAVERLLVEIRRLEREDDDLAADAWGELYVLLGRGYVAKGWTDQGERHLLEAIERIDGTAPPRGEALLHLARLERMRDELEPARERLDEVVRDYVDTRVHLPAVLERAEIHGILGDAEASRADYDTVVATLRATGDRRDVDRARVAASLGDRHTALLLAGDLPGASAYVEIAEGLYDPSDVPPWVLRGIAAVSRQIADDTMAGGFRAIGVDSEAGDRAKEASIELVDPAVRHEAAEAYERAADYYLRHARALTAVAGGDDAWAESLWSSADGYDRAGLRELAIDHFREYADGRSVDDARWGQAVFRLGQAYEAEERYADGAAAYERVIAERPRSAEGTRSIVPLARCYAATGRERDAEEVLVRLVDGRDGVDLAIEPDAPDYLDALVELGCLYDGAGRTREAIERLDTAAARLAGDDDRSDDVLYRLADNLRRNARTIRASLATEPPLPPRERREREALAQRQLERALETFARIIDRDRADGDPIDRDLARYAALARADSAFDLGRFDLAAKLYDEAQRRYSDHHASMHALVQIVNCYHRLGRERDAEIAHQNALARLQQLPDDAFDDAGALMDRSAWAEWLENRPAGPTQVSDATAPN